MSRCNNEIDCNKTFTTLVYDWFHSKLNPFSSVKLFPDFRKKFSFAPLSALSRCQILAADSIRNFGTLKIMFSVPILISTYFKKYTVCLPTHNLRT